MDNRIIDALATIRDMYGDGIFYNHTKTKNLLHDLSPELRKERIQVTHFLEMNGYFQLKYAGRSYYIIRNRLITNYAHTYAVGEGVAAWVVDVFGSLLGYNDIRSGAQYHRDDAPPPSLPATEPPAPGTPPHDAAPYGINPSGVERPIGGVIVDLPKAAASNIAPTAVAGLREGVDYTARFSADFHSVAVASDGRVLAAGLNEDGQCHTSTWWDMKAVSAGTYFTIGLRADGTVAAVGRNDFGQCNVRQWTDIAAISAGARHTVGLRKDGTVVAAGQNKSGECNVHNWHNIIRVVAGYQCTFGIKKDRRVLVRGNNKTGDLTVSHLNGVVDIANAATGRAVALLCDGRVVRIGREDYMQRDFSKWRDIRQISAGPDYIAGLREDGTVKLLAYFWEDSGIECNVDDWREVAYIAAGRYHLMGLRKDGTLLAAMLHPDHAHNRGQCAIGHWNIR